MHYHVAFTETYTAVRGTLDMYLGRKLERLRLNAGESVTVRLYEARTFANLSDQPCIKNVETRPTGGVVKAFQLAYAVANDGGAAKDGLPRNPLIRLRFIQISQGFFPALLLHLQRAIFAVARFLSMAFGVERRVDRYLTTEWALRSVRQ